MEEISLKEYNKLNAMGTDDSAPLKPLVTMSMCKKPFTRKQLERYNKLKKFIAIHGSCSEANRV